jgi:SAM-dependent methyltransferase
MVTKKRKQMIGGNGVNHTRPLMLDLGCGAFTRAGFVGVDIWPAGTPMFKGVPAKTDVVANLNKGIPFGDSEVDQIYSGHFLEHVDNPTFLIEEMWRVCRDGAIVETVVPIWEHHSVDHKTIFFPGWGKRFFTEDKWELVEVRTKEKYVETSVGLFYTIFEQMVITKVIK